MFAQKKVTLPAGRHKIVILDEADSMTEGAQQALRRTIELYSTTTRFALACNQSNKIIEAIQSRCAVLRYTMLKDSELLMRLEQVCRLEKVRQPHHVIKYQMMIHTSPLYTKGGQKRLWTRSVDIHIGRRHAASHQQLAVDA